MWPNVYLRPARPVPCGPRRHITRRGTLHRQPLGWHSAPAGENPGNLTSRLPSARFTGKNSAIVSSDSAMLSTHSESSEKWTTSHRNPWTTSLGIGGQLRLESVDNLPPNTQPPQVSSAPNDSSVPMRSWTHSTASAGRQESSAPQHSLPFIGKENKQLRQSSTSSRFFLSHFPETLQALADFPGTRLADDGIVSNMIRQVLVNTPDASDSEIAEFVPHKGREIRNP